MKNKQELAQSLSEHLDRVDESLLQHAHQIDTAEKFHALDGKQKKIRFTKDRPVTTFHRVAAITVCLVVALGIALCGIALAGHLPGIFGPTPTNPPLTQPSDTTRTEPTDGIDFKEPPRIYISHTQVNTQLPPLSYSWTYDDAGYSVTINTDVCHPLQATSITQLTYKSIPAYIIYEAVPDKITIRCWDAKYQGNDAGFDLYEVISTSEAYGNHCKIELKPGSYVYEIAAEWTDVHGSYGSASYVFAATVSNDGPASRDVTISSGDATIHIQHEFFCYGSFCTGDGTICADGIGARRSLNHSSDETDISTIPILTLDQKISFQLAEHGTLQWVEVFSQNADGEFVVLENFAGTVEALSKLPLGTWFVAFNVEWQDTCIHGDREKRCYDHLFILEVDHEIYTSRDITIYSGAKSITNPMECLVWKKVYENGWVFTEGSGAYGYLNTGNLTAIPTLTLDKAVTIQLGDNGALDAADVYFQTEDGQWALYADLPASVDSLAELPLGTWYIAIRVTWNGRLMEEQEQYEQFCTEHLFILEVTQQSNVENPGGTCGENATWELDMLTGTLTISGTGAMADAHPDPWLDYADKILQIIIEPGITSIGSFSSLQNLVAVQIPDSVVTLQEEAFFNCVALETITLPDSITFIGDRTFDCCSSLQSIRLPSGITAIGRNTFSGCYSLTAITLPDSITTIGNSAFSGCGLTELHLPDHVTTIDDGAFRNCWALESITFGSKLTTIGNSAFVDCTSLAEIILPDCVTSVGDYAFWGCNSLTRVRLSANMKHINQSTFHECGMLSEVVIPAGVTNIQLYAFYMCNNLATIELPNTVTTIGEYAFSGCGLIELHLPDSVRTIASMAFNACSMLQSIVIPEAVTEIGNAAFGNNPALQTIFCEATQAPNGWDSNWNRTEAQIYWGDQWIYIDGVPGEKPVGDTCGENATWTLHDGVLTISGTGAVTEVSWRPFKDQITKVIVEDGITSLCTSVFAMHSMLEEAVIADSVTEMTSKAFWCCVALKTVKLPSGLTVIGAETFNDCTALQQLVIPDGVTTIGQWVFGGCEALTEITLPKSLIAIEESAFNGCSALAQIAFPAGLTSIADYAFNNCTALKALYFYGDPPAIEFYTFNRVNAEVYYPVGNRLWEESGLNNKTGNLILYPMTTSGSCGDALNWTYADGVLTISGTGEMFEYSNRNVPPWRQYAGMITKLDLSEGITRISRSAFVGLSKITSVEIPNTVTAIDSQAFSECTGLTSIVIPDSVRTIASMAFNACSNLQTITFGKGITNIEMYAFMQCPNLSEMHFLGDMPQMSEALMFMTLTIYYPAGNDTWDPSTFASYGSSHTWIPVEITP